MEEGYTIELLADILIIDRWLLEAYERGLDCSLRDAEKIAKVLGVEISDLTGKDKIEDEERIYNADLMREIKKLQEQVEAVRVAVFYK